MYLSSPPSGCNPDSDSSPLSLSPREGEVFARSESTWLGILTPIQVTYLSVLFIQLSMYGEGVRFMRSFTRKEWERAKTHGRFERSLKFDTRSLKSDKLA